MLTPQESEALFATLRTMAEEGRTVIFISHKLHEVKAVADRVTVLRGGRTSRRSRPRTRRSRELAALMVGRRGRAGRSAGRGRRRPRASLRSRSTALSVRGDRGEEAVRGVSLTIRRGEIVGVAGVAGNGQRELAEAITGMRPAADGAVRVEGLRLRTGDPRAAIAAGVAHVPEDRLGTGVAPSLSDRRELGAEDVPPGAGVPRAAARAGARSASVAADLIERYDVQTPGPDAPRARASPAATCRSSCSAASSPASRTC